MIKVENIKVSGIEEAIYAMRNSYNSWDKSDSNGINIGPNDMALARNLVLSGPAHCKFRRIIMVIMDITAPLYFWKQFDTYKIGTTALSCSTMHTITASEFTIDDFSHDYLSGVAFDSLNVTINVLNELRGRYLRTHTKDYWHQIIQLLPSSYNQQRRVLLNYEVLSAMYNQRKHHKLDEWNEFCHDIETRLPYPELIR